MTYRAAMARYKEDLEKSVEMVMEAGLSTGHADDFPELMTEVLDQLVEIREALAARSTFISHGCKGTKQE